MKIKNFFSFINESVSKEVTFQFSSRFGDIIDEIDSPISDEIFNIRLSRKTDISLVDLSDDPSMVSFIPSNKLIKHLNVSDSILHTLIKPLYDSNADIYHKYRVNMKVGRFINKLFGDEFSKDEIHKFVNQYKSLMSENILDFKFYEGFDIKKGYRSINYTFDGQSGNELLNSCMNDRQDLIDFYSGCPVKLLVLEDSNNKIFGRSLVWSLQNGKTFMDRVYVANQYDYWKFINHAKENGWIWKKENKSGDGIKITDGKESNYLKLSVDLKFNFEDYKDWGVPYLDTFIYARGRKLYNYIPDEPGRYYVLNASDGTYDSIFISEF